MRFVDMHCHLDLMANGPEVASEAAAIELGILNASVAPRDYLATRDAYRNSPTVRCAAGLHPWWIGGGTCDDADVDILVRELEHTPFVGEIGLDYGKRHGGSAEAQRAAFDRIVRTCAEHPLPGRVLTIHAVHAANEVLDVLERYDLPRTAACIIHWFSGTSDELSRARSLGCLFSVNEFMLQTRRGREYARQIPPDRLLLETDLPADRGPGSAGVLAASLERALTTIAELKGADAAQLGQQIYSHSCRLLGIAQTRRIPSRRPSPPAYNTD